MRTINVDVDGAVNTLKSQLASSKWMVFYLSIRVLVAWSGIDFVSVNDNASAVGFHSVAITSGLDRLNES